MLSLHLRNSNLKIIQLKVPDKHTELGILFTLQELNAIIPMYKENTTRFLLFPQNNHYKFWVLVFANIFQNILLIFTNLK